MRTKMLVNEQELFYFVDNTLVFSRIWQTLSYAELCPHSKTGKQSDGPTQTLLCENVLSLRTYRGRVYDMSWTLVRSAITQRQRISLGICYARHTRYLTAPRQ